VLVYFHGGAYNNGTVNSDLYDGRRLCHRGDVVVVTVNHRLNAFGYMYLGDLAAEYAQSGNAGQLDLVLALQWVKENIAEFGGDPARVLIFGQSARAKCAALMATPAAKGLFHRVMTMSGQQIKGASIEIAAGRAKTVLTKMGASGLKDKALVAKLNSLTMEEIQEGARAVSADWLPVVDGVALPRNPFDPDAPKLSETVPMMLGNVHDETAVAGAAGRYRGRRQRRCWMPRCMSTWDRTRRRRWWRSSARSIPSTRRCRWIRRRRRPSARGRGSAGRRSGELRIR